MPDTPFLVFEDETFGVCPISSLKGHFLKRKSAYSSKDAVKIEKRLTYSPFYPRWSFGYNKSVPFLNLTTSTHSYIFYTSAHIGIIYDYKYKEMKLLQGHKNYITSASADREGKWIVTADSGDDNTVVVWDADNCLPVFTRFNPHGDKGTSLVAMSPNAKYFLSISKSIPHTVAFWEWTVGNDNPIGKVELNELYGEVKHITFNSQGNEHFILTTLNNVIFMSWDAEANELTSHFPEMPSKSQGSPTQSTYLLGTCQALTATLKGNVVVWSDNPYTDVLHAAAELKNKMNVSKIVQLEKSAITVLKAIDNLVVTGNAKGQIKFYDKSLRILFWGHKFHLDSLVSINFHLSGHQYLFRRRSMGSAIKIEKKDIHSSIFNLVPSDATLERKPFVVRDYIVGTESGQMALVSSIRNKCHFIFDRLESVITAIDVHPQKKHLLSARSDGVLTLINYKKKTTLLEKKINLNGEDLNYSIYCLKYAPSGYFIACSFGNGYICLLDPILLVPSTCGLLRSGNSMITKIIISNDSQYLAYKDEGLFVSVYKCTDVSGNEVKLIGRQRSHYKPIRDITFAEPTTNAEKLRLFSVGEDRMLVEYDLSNGETLTVISTDRIEQIAVPLCMIINQEICDESAIMIANSGFKYKFLDSETKQCVKTVLGPTFGEPVDSFQLLPTFRTSTDQLYALISAGSQIGLQMLPLDGNPYKAVTMIGHPIRIAQMCQSPDAKYLFTLGNNDRSILMWQINIRAIDIIYHLGGAGLTPYYSLLQGGDSGPLMKEIEDYFYYAQILHQGDEYPIEYKISDSIPLCELANIVRAIGFYPTESQLKDMIHEVLCNVVLNEGSESNHIKFDDFLKLYLNHRPVDSISMDLVKSAFETFAIEDMEGKAVINMDYLLNILQEKGEKLDHSEITEYFNILLKPKEPDESLSSTSSESQVAVLSNLPKELSFCFFIEEILGLPSCTEEPDKE